MTGTGTRHTYAWWWWALHNCVAHPWLTFSGDAGWAVRFHDWTAEKGAAAEVSDGQ